MIIIEGIWSSIKVSMVDMNCRLKNRLYDDYVGGERLVDQNMA